MLGLAIGCNYQMIDNGIMGMIQIILGIGIIMAFSYPIYLIKGLGAGDIKLFCVISCFMTSQEVIKVVIVSLIVGSAIGIIIIIKSKKWLSLWNELKEKKKITYTKIHFSIPIFISVLLQIGGVY